MKSKMRESRRIKKALRKVMLSKNDCGFIAIPSVVVFKYPKLLEKSLRQTRKMKMSVI